LSTVRLPDNEIKTRFEAPAWLVPDSNALPPRATGDREDELLVTREARLR